MKRDEIVTFNVLKNEHVPITMAQGAVLFFGLHGVGTVQTVQEVYEIGEATVYVVSPLMLYRVHVPANASMISIRLSPEILTMAGWTDNTTIECYLSDGESKDALAVEIRQRCAALFRAFFQEDGVSVLAGQAIDLASVLKKRFSATASARIVGSAETLERLEDILRFIQTHWNESISIPDLAARYFLSESYISRLFRKYLHMTFTEYLVSIRLEHAMVDLRENNASITQIAYENGFKSTNSFIKYFRQRHGITPGQYRLEHPSHTADSERVSIEDPADWMQTLLQFDDGFPSASSTLLEEQHYTVQVDTTQTAGPIRHTWRKLVNIGYAHDGLIGEVQDQLRRAKKEIGFTDLRFHGIFDDDMHIYQVNKDGSPWYNFTYTDLLFDFIISIGLTPYVELSFMPSKLVKKTYARFHRQSLISTYEDAEKWEALVQATVAHWIDRYGLDRVCTWHFTILPINYTQLSQTPFPYEDYLEMYMITYRTLKALDPRLRLGGPGVFASIALTSDCAAQFLNDVCARGCPPDFLTAFCYPHESIIQDSEFLYFTENQTSTPAVLSEDTDFTAHFLQNFRALAEQCGLSDREIILEEWSPTLWQRDLSSDTCYKSAWLVKNILQNYDNADVLAYWLLTDFLEEWFVPGGVFHGGFGLFTLYGIPKAGYQALRLLTQVGDQKIASGEGWFVSRSDNAIQIFLYHYCHYDALYRYRYQKLSDPRDAYKVFRKEGDLHITLELTGLFPGSYRQEQRIINRAAGSSYDKWLEIGAPTSIRQKELQYLSETAQPTYEFCTRDTTGTMTFDVCLKPHEVMLFILQKRDY